MRFKIAVTGGVAQGKSTVVEELRSLGLTTVSADEVAREVGQLPNVRMEIAAALGLPTDYERARLRERVATDPSARLVLNGIVHRRTLAALEASPAAVVEVPLLFEAGLLCLADEIWTVTCSREAQLSRLAERLGSANDARRWIDAQLPSGVKSALSDWTVCTDAPRAEVARLVAARARFLGLIE